MNPMQYAIYKGTGGKFGALQFNKQDHHFYKDKQKDYTGATCFEEVEGRRKLMQGWKEREGCIFLEATSAIGDNKYDWTQKVIMALSVTDLGKLLYFLITGQSPNPRDREKDGKETKSMSLMHDPGAKSNTAGQVRKYISIYSPKGPANGAMFTVTSVTGSEKREHRIPITGDEVMVLRSLLQQAISSALSW